MSRRKVVENPRALAAALRPGERLMGLDVGTRTIGVALSDVGRTIATPHSTIRRTRFKADAAALRRIVDDNGVGGVVVGLPVNMDGSEGPRCQSVRQFAANLHAEIDVAVAFFDERLTTAAAERMLIAADVSRKRRRALVDRMAAAYILQGALDVAARG